MLCICHPDERKIPDARACDSIVPTRGTTTWLILSKCLPIFMPISVAGSRAQLPSLPHQFFTMGTIS
jgi:hypothetical protein